MASLKGDTSECMDVSHEHWIHENGHGHSSLLNYQQQGQASCKILHGQCYNTNPLMKLFVTDISALLAYYAARSGNSSPTFRDNLSVPLSWVKNLIWIRQVVPKRR